MSDGRIDVNNTFIDKTTLFERKYDKSIDVFGEIDSLYKELCYVGELPIINCDKISSENLSWTTTKWALEKEDGTRILVSDKYSIDETWEKDLNELSLETGTKLFIKALISFEGTKGNVILQYVSQSETTACFHLNGNAFNANLSFIGINQ
ncbi:MAG: hypothetical protein RR844_06940 [Clostridium sp.]